MLSLQAKKKMIVNMKEKVELMKTACATPDEGLLETWEKEFRAKL